MLPYLGLALKIGVNVAAVVLGLRMIWPDVRDWITLRETGAHGIRSVEEAAPSEARVRPTVGAVACIGADAGGPLSQRRP
jgi:hypothetical protein